MVNNKGHFIDSALAREMRLESLWYEKLHHVSTISFLIQRTDNLEVVSSIFSTEKLGNNSIFNWFNHKGLNFLNIDLHRDDCNRPNTPNLALKM